MRATEEDPALVLGAWAADVGDRIAVNDGRRAMTFAQLYVQALPEARDLRHSTDHAPGRLTVIPARSDPTFFVSVLAAWLAGRTPLPVPPRAAREVCGQLRNARQIHTPRCQAWKAILRSGQNPRAVLLTHGETPAVPRKAEALGMTSGGTALITSPLYLNGPFEFAIRQLLMGGTVALAAPFSPSTWVAAARATRPTWAFAVPTQLGRLLAEAGRDAVAAAAASLQTLMFSSQPCPPRLRRQIAACVGLHRLAEYYGTAEYDGALTRGPALLTGGGATPIPGARLRVITRDGHPASSGSGRIEGASSSGVTCHRLTLPCPPPGGWHGVGDRGRLTTSGHLYVTSVDVPGRAIVGGVKVDLERVRRHVENHPGVVECRAHVVPDDDLGQAVTLNVLTTSTSVTAINLHRYCRAHLQAGERPRHIAVAYDVADRT